MDLFDLGEQLFARISEPCSPVQKTHFCGALKVITTLWTSAGVPDLDIKDTNLDFHMGLGSCFSVGRGGLHVVSNGCQAGEGSKGNIWIVEGPKVQFGAIYWANIEDNYWKVKYTHSSILL